MLPHEKVTDALIKTVGKSLFPSSSDMYADGMTNFSRAKQNPNAEVININNVDEKLKQKLKEFGTQPNERGVHYNNQSEVSRLFSNSPEVKKIKDDFYNDIKQGRIHEANVDFESDVLKDFLLGRHKNIDRHTSIQNGQMVNLNIDKDDNLTGNLIDRQDYNKRNLKSWKDISTILNNYGYNMQEKGNLENNFSIIDIVSGENFDEEDNLLKKLLKYYRKKF